MYYTVHFLDDLNQASLVVYLQFQWKGQGLGFFYPCIVIENSEQFWTDINNQV